MLQVKGTTVRLGEVDLLQNPFGQITQKAMVRAVQHMGLLLRIRADVTIAGGTTSGTVRNRGLLRSIIRRINISENGDRSTEIDGRVLGEFQTMMVPKIQNETVALANGDAQANTILEDFLFLPFANPLLATPTETNFLERDPDQDVDVEFETVAVPYTQLVDGGDRTLTVNALTVEIGQQIDRVTTSLPFFVPQYRQIANQPITGAVTDFEIEIKPKGFIAALVVQQIGEPYEVTDIISRLELKSSNTRHFEGRFTDDFMRQLHELEFGGAVTDGYVIYNFLKNGRLSGIHNPADPDLRLIVDAGLSAIGGQESIRIWALEFLQDPGITQPLPEALVG